MNTVKWTPPLVEARFVEAADVMKRLPEVRVPGYFSTWPKIIYEFCDLVEQKPGNMKRPPPSPQSITRAEETMGWLSWLEPTDRKIVLMRASRKPWKAICYTIGLSRATAHQHWLFAHSLIALKLSGSQVPKRPTKGRVIERARIPEELSAAERMVS